MNCERNSTWGRFSVMRCKMPWWWWCSLLVVSNSWDPMDCSPPGCSVYGIFQARILQWVAVFFSRGSSWPRNWTWISCLAGSLFTNWARMEDQEAMGVWNWKWPLDAKNSPWKIVRKNKESRFQPLNINKLNSANSINKFGSMFSLRTLSWEFDTADTLISAFWYPSFRNPVMLYWTSDLQKLWSNKWVLFKVGKFVIICT